MNQLQKYSKKLVKSNNTLLHILVGFLAGILVTHIYINSIPKNTNGTFESMKQVVEDPSISNIHVAGVSVEEMIYNLEAKEGGDFEKSYLAMMTYYFENGIELSRLAQGKAKHSDLRSQAGSQEIYFKDQIDTLLAWYELWGFKKLDEQQQNYESNQIPHSSGIDGH